MTTSESKGRFFYKTNRFESIRITNRIESIRIANWNALVLLCLSVCLPGRRSSRAWPWRCSCSASRCRRGSATACSPSLSCSSCPSSSRSSCTASTRWPCPSSTPATSSSEVSSTISRCTGPSASSSSTTTTGLALRHTRQLQRQHQPPVRPSTSSRLTV